jgi:hypothetical protein
MGYFIRTKNKAKENYSQAYVLRHEGILDLNSMGEGGVSSHIRDPAA